MKKLIGKIKAWHKKKAYEKKLYAMDHFPSICVVERGFLPFPMSFYYTHTEEEIKAAWEIKKKEVEELIDTINEEL